MSIRDKRYDNMIFNYETTGRTDYRKGAIKPKIKTKYQEKSTCARVRLPPLKDLHALTDWKKPSVPFNLMHKPKDIVQTNPRKTQEPYYHPADLQRKEVQMTRPRLVMTPAVSMDDIDDMTRKMLTEDMYTTALALAEREACVAAGRSVCAPLPSAYAAANPITLAKLQRPLVPLEWRMETVAWDNRQLRAHCDPTREFWLQSALPHT